MRKQSIRPRVTLLRNGFLCLNRSFMEQCINGQKKHLSISLDTDKKILTVTLCPGPRPTVYSISPMVNRQGLSNISKFLERQGIMQVDASEFTQLVSDKGDEKEIVLVSKVRKTRKITENSNG